MEAAPDQPQAGIAQLTERLRALQLQQEELQRQLGNQQVRTTTTVRNPELFKPGMDIESWLRRMDHHFAQANIRDDRDKAMGLSNGLSLEAFTKMDRLGLTQQQWTEVATLRDHLRITFSDLRTQAVWVTEFQTAKQDAKETVGEFLDRLVYDARQAYPELARATADPATLLKLVKQRYVDALRSKEIRRTLLLETHASLARLRESAVVLEQAEWQLTGKTGPDVVGTSHATGVSESANTNPVVAATSFSAASETKSQSKQAGKLASGGGQQPVKGRFLGNCYNCGKVGHSSKFCRAPQSVNAPSARVNSVCTRCGRYGHAATACWASHQLNGELLVTPAPVQKPAQRQVGQSAHSNPNPPTPVPGNNTAASSLNLNGDAHAPSMTRPPSTLTKW